MHERVPQGIFLHVQRTHEQVILPLAA